MIAVVGQGSNRELVENMLVLANVLGWVAVAVFVVVAGIFVAEVFVLPILRAYIDRANRRDAEARAEKSRAWREVQRRAWASPDPEAWRHRFDRSAS